MLKMMLGKGELEALRALATLAHTMRAELPRVAAFVLDTSGDAEARRSAAASVVAMAAAAKLAGDRLWSVLA